MHVHRVSFTGPASPLEDDEPATDAIDLLLGAWRMSGQVCGREWAIAREGGGYVTTVMSPEADSLAVHFDNRYVSAAVARLRETGFDVQWQSLGENPSSSRRCDCASPSAYTLFTTFVSLESPIRCLECFCPVALHRFEPTDNDEFHDVVVWQSNYQSCDRLQMNCRVLERTATRELSNIASNLTRDGRALCATLAQSSGRPFYYYLYRARGRSKRAEIARPCPGCGQPWHLSTPLHRLFDFKCERCHLLSNVAFDLT